MRLIMRNAVLAAAMLLCTVGTARATTSPLLEANVPFPFVINGQTFPAGRYTIGRDDTASSVMLIRGEKGNRPAAFISTTQSGDRDPAGSGSVLLFTPYEKQYRLSGIWTSATEGLSVTR